MGAKLKIIIASENGEVWEQFLIRRERVIPEAEEARRVRDYIERRYDVEEKK